jgi:hypothetical protein
MHHHHQPPATSHQPTTTTHHHVHVHAPRHHVEDTGGGVLGAATHVRKTAARGRVRIFAHAHIITH